MAPSAERPRAPVAAAVPVTVRLPALTVIVASDFTAVGNEGVLPVPLAVSNVAPESAIVVVPPANVTAPSALKPRPADPLAVRLIVPPVTLMVASDEMPAERYASLPPLELT